MQPRNWFILAAVALVLAFVGYQLSPAAPESASSAGSSGSSPTSGQHAGGSGGSGSDASPRARNDKAGPNGALPKVSREQAAALGTALVDAAEVQRLRSEVKGTSHTAEELETMVAEVSTEGAAVESLGTRCSPAPCVTAFRYDTRAEGAAEVQDAIYGRAMELAAEAEEGQPTMEWDEPEGGEGIRTGYLWYVPDGVSEAESQALVENVQAHKDAFAGR